LALFRVGDRVVNAEAQSALGTVTAVNTDGSGAVVYDVRWDTSPAAVPERSLAVPPSVMPFRFFAFEVAYLVLLIALLVVYKTDHAFRAALPPFGPLPVQVVWFGAAGGVLAALGGVYFHNADWRPAYKYWYYSRPLVSGVVGGIGCLLFYVSLTLGTTKGVTPNVITFDTVGFLLGFADKSFRVLISRLTRLLFAPGESVPPD
jgi:hypothetical protein